MFPLFLFDRHSNSFSIIEVLLCNYTFVGDIDDTRCLFLPFMSFLLDERIKYEVF